VKDLRGVGVRVAGSDTERILKRHKPAGARFSEVLLCSSVLSEVEGSSAGR
jgi:hypothetical protein